MYQGKFDSKKKNSQLTVHEVVEQRNAAHNRKKHRADPVKKQEVKQSAKQHTVQRSTPKKDPLLGSIKFYAVFFLCVLIFYGGFYIGLLQINNWLLDFESAQPRAKSEEVFAEYFQNPDWGQLYDLSSSSDGNSQSKAVFIAYMEDKVQGQTLSFTGTSAGLSGNKKYIVRAGNQKLASFLLVNQNPSKEDTDIPDWQLGEITFFVQTASSYYIETLEGYRVTVNGTELREDQVVSKTTTKAAGYLPQGVQAEKRLTYRIDGLLVQPSVQIYDKGGNAVSITEDPASRSYTALPQAQTITQEEEELALNAVKAQCKYSITTKFTDADLAKYFARATETYESMTSMDRRFLQEPKSYDFTDASVTNMQRYSDSLYSVRVCLTMTQTRSNGSTKDTKIDESLFFEKQASGKWLCSNLTAVDVSQEVRQVRLTFQQNDAVLLDEFFEADAKELTCPAVSIPEGKSFTGWTVQQTDPNGNTVVSLVFQPDESDRVTIPSGTVLTPMVLEPLFE